MHDALPYFRAVKLLCLLLTAYLFALSCLPCAGCDHDHHAAAEHAAVSISPEKSHQHHPEANACNPLSACACHAGFTIAARVFAEPEPVAVPGEPLVFPERSSQPTRVSERVWQPPRA